MNITKRQLNRYVLYLCALACFALLVWAFLPARYTEPRQYAPIVAYWGNGIPPTYSYRVGMYYYEDGELPQMPYQHAGTPIDWIYVEEEK